MTGILDYGMGNLGSVTNALTLLNIKNKVITHSSEFESIERLIIPGVGSFKEAVLNIDKLGLKSPIRQFANDKPILGICLGMQLLCNIGYENGHSEGLGLVEGEVKYFEPNNLRVPHMGWNGIHIQLDHPIFQGVKVNADFYFVHSFHCDLVPKNNILATTDYGYPFPSIIANDTGNVVGCQFHPEKSQKQGLRILENFSQLC